MAGAGTAAILLTIAPTTRCLSPRQPLLPPVAKGEGTTLPSCRGLFLFSRKGAHSKKSCCRGYHLSRGTRINQVEFVGETIFSRALIKDGKSYVMICQGMSKSTSS
jgi:hypothetical protein